MCRYLLILAALAAVPARGAPKQDVVHKYDAGAFYLDYIAPLESSSALTQFHDSIKDDSNGLVFTTVDLAAGLLRTKDVSQTFALKVVPLAVFEAPARSPEELIADLTKHADRDKDEEASFAVEQIAGNTWVRASWTAKKSGLTRAVSWYMSAYNQSWVVATYQFFPGLTQINLASQIARLRTTVSSIRTEAKKPAGQAVAAPPK